MRGAQELLCVGRQFEGIIPADAGSTAWLPVCCCASEDHPRGCGEHNDTFSFREFLRGSSPRMRGAPAMKITSTIQGRIIPADAGSTAAPCAKTDLAGDHPRGCGEHSSGNCSFGIHSGSSPRMRGAHHRRPNPSHGGRIIPADAGSTLKDPCNPNNMIDKISDF